MKKYSYTLVIEGLNFDRLFKNLDANGIVLYNFRRHSYKKCEFSLSLKDYIKANSLNFFKEYKLSMSKTYNFGWFLSTFVRNIGLYVGIMASIVIGVLIGHITLKIDVLGNNKIDDVEIIESLNQIGVSTNKVNTVSNEEIEQYIKTEFEEVSLVSVVKRGTNLIVNIKEKELIIDNFSPICADTNMLINKINIVQGVAKVCVGDIVKKGDVLVEPITMLSSGKLVQLQPIATIEATGWISGVVDFDEEEKVYLPTGNKQVISYYDVFNSKIFFKTNNVKFEKYEKKVYNEYVFENMFLPIKLNREIYTEIEEKVVSKNFEDYKESLVEKSKALAYSKLPKGVNVDNEITKISKVNNKYFVTTYLQINIKIEG